MLVSSNQPRLANKQLQFWSTTMIAGDDNSPSNHPNVEWFSALMVAFCAGNADFPDGSRWCEWGFSDLTGNENLPDPSHDDFFNNLAEVNETVLVCKMLRFREYWRSLFCLLHDGITAKNLVGLRNKSTRINERINIWWDRAIGSPLIAKKVSQMLIANDQPVCVADWYFYSTLSHTKVHDKETSEHLQCILTGVETTTMWLFQDQTQESCKLKCANGATPRLEGIWVQ